MATQELGADRDFIDVIQGGPPGLVKYFTQVRKIKDTIVVKPGLVVCTNGETDGEVDLGADGDGAAGSIEIVLYESPQGAPSAIITDGTKEIDRTITGAAAAPKMVMTLRKSSGGFRGGLFTVAAIRADESNDTEYGEPMVLEATGHIKKFAWADSAAGTDTCIEAVGDCAEVTTDVAGTDLVQLIHW